MYTLCRKLCTRILKGSDFMMSFIMLIIAVILAAVGLVFIKPSDNIKRDNIKRDNIKRNNKIAITFFALATIMALVSVASSMLPSSAPLP